jgi:hypothetical protein
VRAGNIEDAVKLCRDAHQPWRAASIRGSLLFSWPAICEFPFLAVAAYCYDLKLNYTTLSVSHSAARRCSGRRGGRRSGPLVREQTACLVEDSLHALRSRLPPVVRRTRFIRRARAVRPDLNRPQVLLSHVGRRALGDDFCFMRRATERGTCTVEWGILGAIRERVGGRRCG